MRKFFGVTLIYFNCISAFLLGQNFNLNIPFVQQKAHLWCWATCVQMIDTHHKTHIGGTNFYAQNEIVNNYFNTFREGAYPCNSYCVVPQSCKTFCSNCPTNSSTSSACNDCNIAIEPLDFQYPRLWNTMGYYAMYDDIILSNNAIKDQIDNGKPFVLNLANYDPKSSTKNEKYEEGKTTHAVVGKGYCQCGNTLKLVFINDPFSTNCNSHDYWGISALSLPLKKYYIDSVENDYNSVITTAHDIRLIEKKIGEAVVAPQSSNNSILCDLIKIIESLINIIDIKKLNNVKFLIEEKAIMNLNKQLTTKSSYLINFSEPTNSLFQIEKTDKELKVSAIYDINDNIYNQLNKFEKNDFIYYLPEINARFRYNNKNKTIIPLTDGINIYDIKFSKDKELSEVEFNNIIMKIQKRFYNKNLKNNKNIFLNLKQNY